MIKPIKKRVKKTQVMPLLKKRRSRSSLNLEKRQIKNRRNQKDENFKLQII